jgi:acyl-CoA thioester hydrolase
MADIDVTYRGTVYPAQCDHMGHMNVMFYVQKFDEAVWQLLASIGLTGARMRDDQIGMAAVEQHIIYKRELRAGDSVSIRSGLVDVRDKSLRIWHEMRDDVTGELCASMEVVGVHIEAVTRRARSLPPDVREQAQSLASTPVGHHEG